MKWKTRRWLKANARHPQNVADAYKMGYAQGHADALLSPNINKCRNPVHLPSDAPMAIYCGDCKEGE